MFLALKNIPAEGGFRGAFVRIRAVFLYFSPFYFSMADIYVVLVEPLYQGNIGYLARLSYNFGVRGMYMVGGPGELTDEAISRAMHGVWLLDEMKRVTHLKELKSELDFLVGTSAVSWFSQKKHERIPLTPRELGRWALGVEGSVGIVFGREDKGLSREEISMMDLMVTIPANPSYPTLSISHAASIILYELHLATLSGRPWRVPRKITGYEKEALIRQFSELADVLPINPARKGSAKVHFRRIIARASPTSWEFFSLMGVFSEALRLIKEKGR
ncbi:MAG: RNA methyltransferase [Thermoplasmata archaeon]|nr:MAG: RNA methyltransferase [Thermoplasmata archaeon]